MLIALCSLYLQLLCAGFKGERSPSPNGPFSIDISLPIGIYDRRSFSLWRTGPVNVDVNCDWPHAILIVLSSGFGVKVRCWMSWVSHLRECPALKTTSWTNKGRNGCIRAFIGATTGVTTRRRLAVAKKLNLR